MVFFKTTFADFFAVSLPALSAILSVASGVLAILRYDNCAAVLGIIGGLSASGGIIATYHASKVRDDQMRFWIITNGQNEAQPPAGFAS